MFFQNLINQSNTEKQLKLVAELIQKKPELLQQFNESYNKALLHQSINEIRPESKPKTETSLDSDKIIEKIVEDLVIQTPTYTTDSDSESANLFISQTQDSVDLDDILALPEQLRPQLTSQLQKNDVTKSEASYMMLLANYMLYLKKNDVSGYHRFRQGLDILDLDDISYSMLDQNPNAMSNWLPQLNVANKLSGGFFKIPKTTVAKVPQTLLQLTRIDYMSLTQSTHDIVNRWAEKVFNLRDDGDYFIKTGTFSSKFDFRNAHVKGGEIKELGDYLLFIQNQAVNMAGFHPNAPTIYGMSTTNEFVVREFISDPENNPTIYQGLPLRTEFRIFIDFDENECLGASPYWRADVMKDRFGNTTKFQLGIHEKHDYVTYSINQKKLESEYNEHIDTLKSELIKLSKQCNLTGQWSIDVMKSGNDFYLIDAAILTESALNDVVPKEKIKEHTTNWLSPAIKILTKELDAIEE